MRKRIILNDQGLYVDCTNEDGRISFEFEKELSTLNDKVKVIKEGDISYGLLGLKRFLKIQKDKISKIMNITTTELRILCALSNRVDYLTENSEDKSINIVSEFNKVLKTLLSLPKGWNKKQVHKTELHTHFLEILNPREFVDFINRYDVLYPIDDEGNIDFKNGTKVTYDELVSLGYEEKLLNSLRLDVSSQSSFEDLTDNIIYKRNGLLQIIVNNNQYNVIRKSSFNSQEFDDLEYYIDGLTRKMSKEEINKLGLSKKQRGVYRDRLNRELIKLISKRKYIVSNILYNELLNESLDKLSREKVEYSEISFSNEDRLEYLSREHTYDDRFNLLYSVDRTDKVDDFKKYSKTLERLLNTDKVIGIDIMGNESALKPGEYDEFKKKIAWLLPVLHMHPNSILRIHASEFKDATDNMLNTLKIIDELSKEINEACISLFGRDWGIIPPPRIRIGHGVNINKNPELISLIKKYDAVIEINASSNYALGNIKSLKDIPLEYYNENGIKYVISTDGGGVYSTSIHQEENLLGEKLSTSESLSDLNEQINRTGSGSVTKEDKELYQMYRKVQEDTIEEKKYSSYMEALDYEKAANQGKSDKEVIEEEIKDLSRYIMDHDPEFDRDYFREMINTITNLNNNKRSDISKMFLYLLESELFPRRKTSFITIEYIDNIKNKKEITNQLELSLVRIFKVVRNEFITESNNIKKYLDGYNDNYGRRK